VLRGLAGPVLIAVGSQLGAAFLDGSLRWGGLVAAIGLAVYHVCQRNRWEDQERRRIESALRLTAPLPDRRRAEWWPRDW
jgi:hypothetical protein